MTKTFTRRGFGKLLGAASTVAAWPSLIGQALAAGDMRLIWWGNPDRDKRTNAVADLYMKQTGGKVATEAYGYGDYWPKLATMAAGRNLPDVLQMDYRFLVEYVQRNQLAALDGFVGKELGLKDYDKSALDSGKVNGKLYAISLGANSMGHVYNKAVLDSLGVKLPDSTKWTTADWVALGKSLKDKLPKGMYFTENMGWIEPRLQTWMRSAGKDLYTEDGKLAYGVEDVVAFFKFWKMMQDEGLTPPADVNATDSYKLEETMLVTKKSLFNFIHSNQLVAMQKLIDAELDMVMIPNSGAKAGQYMKPSQFLSIAETSADKAGAAKLVDYIISNPEANDILLIERGVSSDAAIRKRIADKLTKSEKAIIAYLDVVATWISPLPPPPPKKAGEIEAAQRPAWESVAFGKATPEAAAKDFFEKAQSILDRA